MSVYKQKREAVARAIMIASVCGCSLPETGERVFCDDARLPDDIRAECSCHASASVIAERDAARKALKYTLSAIETGRSEPLAIARDLIRNMLDDASPSETQFCGFKDCPKFGTLPCTVLSCARALRSSTSSCDAPTQHKPGDRKTWNGKEWEFIEYGDRGEVWAGVTPAPSSCGAMEVAAKMRDALEPFVREADRLDPNGPDGTIGDSCELWQCGSREFASTHITYGDLRKARAALRAAGPVPCACEGMRTEIEDLKYRNEQLGIMMRTYKFKVTQLEQMPAISASPQPDPHEHLHQFAVVSSDYSKPFMAGAYPTLERAVKAQFGSPDKWHIFQRVPALSASPQPAHGVPERALADKILAELVRARAKFPGKNVTFAALVEEVGELATATFEESAERVEKEAVQVAVMAMRMVLDGDHCFNEWRAEKGLDPLSPTDRAAFAPSAAPKGE